MTVYPSLVLKTRNAIKKNSVVRNDRAAEHLKIVLKSHFNPRSFDRTIFRVTLRRKRTPHSAPCK